MASAEKGRRYQYRTASRASEIGRFLTVRLLRALRYLIASRASVIWRFVTVHLLRALRYLMASRALEAACFRDVKVWLISMVS